MLADAHSKYGLNFVFQDDNDRKHRCKIVKEFKSINNIMTLPWPAQSPDLNPIERVWDAIKDAIAKRPIPPSNQAQLKQAILEEWSNLSQDYILKLIHSVPRRIAHVLCANGGPTKY